MKPLGRGCSYAKMCLGISQSTERWVCVCLCVQGGRKVTAFKSTNTKAGGMFSESECCDRLCSIRSWITILSNLNSGWIWEMRTSFHSLCPSPIPSSLRPSLLLLFFLSSYHLSSLPSFLFPSLSPANHSSFFSFSLSLLSTSLPVSLPFPPLPPILISPSPTPPSPHIPPRPIPPSASLPLPPFFCSFLPLCFLCVCV